MTTKQQNISEEQSAERLEAVQQARDDRTTSLLSKIIEEAETFEDRARAFNLASAYRQSQAIRAAAVAISETQWGDPKNLSDAARSAVARWCLSVGIDPIRHIYVLGNRIYDNAELYIDKLAADPNFGHAEIRLAAPLDHRDIQRLQDTGALTQESADAIRAEQQRINTERLQLQIEHGVPADINEYPDTAAAAVVTLRFKDGTYATDCNWAGSRGRKKRYYDKQTRGYREGGPADPVGDSDSVKTAKTRAYRKAAKQKMPLWFKQLGITDTDNGAIGDVEAVIQQGREAPMEAGPPVTEVQPGLAIKAGARTEQTALEIPEDGYGLEDG